MSLHINTNVAAMVAHRLLTENDDRQLKSLQRLSSGRRVNQASDDAAGTAISQKMTAQSRGLAQSQRNAQDAISLLQTAEGALGSATELIQRMRELTVQAKNGTLSSQDRLHVAQEIVDMAKALNRIGTDTEFNSMPLLDGSRSTVGFTFQLGANAAQTTSITLGTVSTSALSIPVAYDAALSLTLVTYDLDSYDTALELVSSERSKLGAMINRLGHAITNLGVTAENTEAAQSRIVDLDLARETVNLSRSQILSQSSTAMLAQANQAPQGVLSLLR